MNTWFDTSAIGSLAMTSRASRSGARPWTRAAVGALLASGFLFADVTMLRGQELDAGQLQVRVEGRRVSLERYRVWQNGSTVNAVASIQRPQMEERQVRLQMDPNLVPLRYELREGRVPVVSGERFADRVRVHTVSEEGERWKEYPTRGVTAILEPGVAHHYLLVLRVLREAPGGTTEVLIPSSGRTVTARLVREIAERVPIGDGSVPATRFDIEVEETRHSAWLDSDGRLLRVVDPSSGREAVRVPDDS